ncbi:MAG: HAD family hydrolase [Chloroflexi bacterium]|nr:HAD family hydrolase [Chloroflexota bacterium]MYC48415.1 HAD family hydrolase [Chloroflexota bacterium]
MGPSAVKAVFWDLDDTVLDTLSGRADALTATYEEIIGERPDARELWRMHLGVTIEALAKELTGNDWPRFVERYRAIYYASKEPLEPYPGVVETLEALSSDGLDMAIVTSKISWGARGELERAGLLDYFAAVVGWDDCARPKPAPDPLLVAMERTGQKEPAQIAYVGDVPTDVQAARAAGCRAIGASWGSLDPERLRAAEPDLLAEHPSAVLAYVRRSRRPIA